VFLIHELSRELSGPRLITFVQDFELALKRTARFEHPRYLEHALRRSVLTEIYWPSPGAEDRLGYSGTDLSFAMMAEFYLFEGF